MAAATKTVKEIRTFELSLSEEEATALHDLIYAGVAGDNQKSRRTYLNAIRQALTAAGIKSNDSRSNDVRGVVTFE